LPEGTNANPILQPNPSDLALSYMLLVRQLAGEIDYNTGIVLPMYLYQDPLGNIFYVPAPVGLVQTWLNPDLSYGQAGFNVQKTFQIVPSFSDGVPSLNEFVGQLESTANLSNIRTSIVMEGLNPTDGSAVIGWYNNPYQGSGGDPNYPGYVGLDLMYQNISRYFTTPYAAYVAAQVAAVQMAFPAIGVTFGAHLQSGIFPLTSQIGIQDYPTQGTTAPVGYYPTAQTNSISVETDGYRQSSIITARLLGQAG
jgi:hypothetical protein